MIFTDSHPVTKSYMPPIQPWLLNAMLDYTEVRSKWNSNPAGTDAIYYQFSTGPDTNGFHMIPDGCINFLFNCSHPSSPALVSGIHEYATYFPLEPNSLYFGFKSRSSVGMCIKTPSLKITEAVNSTVSFSLRSSIVGIISELRTPTSIYDRIGVFKEYILPYLIDYNHATDIVQFLSMIFINSKGMAKLNEIGKMAWFTNRYCRKIFSEAYGVSMKKYCRIVKVQNAICEILSDPLEKIAIIAQRAGFSDQSHLSNELRKITSLTPYKFKKLYMQKSCDGKPLSCVRPHGVRFPKAVIIPYRVASA